MMRSHHCLKWKLTPPYLSHFFSVKGERFFYLMEASQGILPCNSLNKPKTAVLKTTVLTLAVYHHSLPLNIELNHCIQTCYSCLQFFPAWVASQVGAWWDEKAVSKSCLWTFWVGWIMSPFRKMVEISHENEGLPAAALLSVAPRKSHPLPPHGQVIHNRPQPQHPCLFLPAPILNQTGAAHLRFHCGALRSQRSN